MAKKRKASGRHKGAADGPNLDVGASRKRIRTFEDVADSDDEFHLNRDKILLGEEPEAKRRRKVREDEEFLEQSDEEVLAYSDEEDDEDGEDEDKVARERAGRGLEEDGDEDDEDVDGDDDGEREDGLGWGTARDEIYGADEIETEEQALAEEAEALRLQKKQLQALSAADYGFDESEWQQGGAGDAAAEKGEDVVVEVLPQLQVGENLSSAERLKLLQSRYPEFEHLRRELPAAQAFHEKLLVEQQRRENAFGSSEAPNLSTQLRATSAYAGALVMYFTLLSSPAARSGSDTVVAMAASQLRDHPVMETLVKCKDLWMRTKMLPRDPEPVLQVPIHATNGHGDDQDLLHEAKKTKRLPPPKSRAQRHADAARQAAETRRTERMHQVEADLADLNDLTKVSVQSRKSDLKQRLNAAKENDSDLGEEETPLTAQEAAAKAQRKKSLRFYASQITQKANKRGVAGRNAGGDDDIPYRERLRDRQARLNAEAEKRGQRQTAPGAELDGAQSDEEDARLADDVRGAGAGDDYYDHIASQTARRKADRAALAAAQKEAALQGGRVVPAETLGADGKRRITYAIEKNKGLTPHRKKEVRNPRVKKRKKFEEKKKKLASTRPVYKGGEGRGGYKGELTGIKRGLVKSVKL